MKTRSEILEWFKREFSEDYYNSDIFGEKVKELSAMLDELIDGVPEFTATIWNEEIMLKIQEWKKEAGK